MIKVPWDEAKAYVAWLGEVTGRPYRLPSEAEWEYCCRAETTTPFWTGATVSTDQARTTTATSPTAGGARANIVVGRRRYPNRWSLHDAHGNVFEWVEDTWHDNYEGAPADGSP